ncbi:hypothetical protein CR513_25227, partial [Mucuna pruriens]
MGSQGPWITDSGASDHISGNESVFSSISSPKFPQFISLANGSKMVSQGVGQVSLSSSISFNSVFFELFSNLLCRFLCYTGLKYGPTDCKGHESRGLYYLSNNPSTLCFASVSPKLLRNRLGHPSLAKLKLMVPSLNKLSTLECESCQLGKHVRSIFPNQVNKRLIMQKEYFSSELNSYLSSKGILHQSTFSYTPQQNGIAERKNKHLVKTARTLLLNANVPTNH